MSYKHKYSLIIKSPLSKKPRFSTIIKNQTNHLHILFSNYRELFDNLFH